MDTKSLQLFGNTYIDDAMILGTWNEGNTKMEVKLIAVGPIKFAFGELTDDHMFDIHVPCNVWLSHDGQLSVKKLPSDEPNPLSVERKYELVHGTEWLLADANNDVENMIPHGPLMRDRHHSESVNMVARVFKLYFRPEYVAACEYSDQSPLTVVSQPLLIPEILNAFLYLTRGAPKKSTYEVTREHIAEIRAELDYAMKAELTALRTMKWFGIFNLLTIPNPQLLRTIVNVASTHELELLDTTKVPFVHPNIESSFGTFYGFEKPTL